MSEQEAIKNIQEIKSILQQRTRFNALSGLSGMLAGSYALIGAFIAHSKIYTSKDIVYREIQTWYNSSDVLSLLGLASVILILAISTGIFFSAKKAKENNENLWSPVTFKILGNLFIFLMTAAIFILVLLDRGFITMISPTCLIFYGLSLINISNLTLSEVKNLGLTVLITGLISLFFPGNGLFFWAMGFGVLHIIYGFIMWYKYDKK
ncbi:MAG: hypothetical protein RLZZ546_1015 [Bacteroidota bacterium]|jgi:hypothetical protein